MNKRQYLLGLVFASLLGGGIALGGYEFLKEDQPIQQFVLPQASAPVANVNIGPKATVPAGLNFVSAAKTVTPAVVHIRSTVQATNANGRSQDQMEQYFKEFFGEPRGRGYQNGPSVGTGSGVIINSEGYIATNNHVVENATDIEILLNDNRTYKAKVIGTDPTTDLALLKIDEVGLPFVRFADSDVIEVGEWVLAIGNPFEFRSTVTAGIISAKGRNINILANREMSIESFIQTDAAVNPGNSGGALVDLNGELVGINTAIATPTGSYAGYSFAVPSNLVKKVIGDLKEFGVVQRALLGINIVSVSAELAEQEGLDVLQGVYVAGVNENSGANEAGIKVGDVIIALNGQRVDKSAELQEKVALNRPGDEIEVTYLREGEERTVSVVLKNTLGTTSIIEATSNNLAIQGATFENISKEERAKLKLEGGAKLAVLESGVWKEAGIKEGFIVTRVGEIEINAVEDLSKALSRSTGGNGVLIAGIYPNGQRAYYGIGW
ncbi:MAG: Do family serine endopeptidase [Reichenbachiella sp.]